MTFDRHQWISEMIAGTIGGAFAGTLGALSVPNPPFAFAVAVAAGGAAGLGAGLVTLPLKWLLDWHPRSRARKSVKRIDSKTMESQRSNMKKSQAKGGQS
jgi:hypothetical protein